jgi:hypothetical protein
MRKTKKLLLNRETLRHLASPTELREAAGGATTPLTDCDVSICVQTCKTCPTLCNLHGICGM